MHQTDVINFIKALYVNTQIKNIYFPETYGSFSKTNHILGNKVSLNKFRKTELTSCILPNHNEIKLDTSSNSRDYREYTKIERLHSMLPNENWTKRKNEEGKFKSPGNV